jgi:hypothetical protein
MPTTALHARNAPGANTPTDLATLATPVSQVKFSPPIIEILHITVLTLNYYMLYLILES